MLSFYSVVAFLPKVDQPALIFNDLDLKHQGLRFVMFLWSILRTRGEHFRNAIVIQLLEILDAIEIVRLEPKSIVISEIDIYLALDLLRWTILFHPCIRNANLGAWSIPVVGTMPRRLHSLFLLVSTLRIGDDVKQLLNVFLKYWRQTGRHWQNGWIDRPFHVG